MTNKGFAENKFDPVIIVNETIISKFELSKKKNAFEYLTTEW